MQGFWDKVGAAIAALVAFWLGEDRQAQLQQEANLQEKIKELKTDAKNREDVGRLSDSELADELHQPAPAGPRRG